MKKTLSMTLLLEDGKNMAFTISNIKNISADEASDIIKTFDYKSVLAKNDLKVTGVKKANIISTSYEEVTVIQQKKTFWSFFTIRMEEKMENIENIISSISNVGFPVVLSIFLLLRFEKKIDELTKAINELVVKLKQEFL